MSDAVQEISEDYYIDDEDNIFIAAFGEDIDRLNSDIKEGNSLEATTQQLLDAFAATERYGINPPAFAAMSAAGLLTGTAFGSLSMESFQGCTADSTETEMALEALSDTITSTMAKWSDKIIDLAKSMAEKVTTILGGLWDGINTQVKRLGSMTWDVTKAASASIKAHPYRTVFAALGAAAAVAAIIGYAATGTYANESATQSVLYKIQDMINKIHWPFGKPNVEIIQNGTKIVYHMEDGGVLNKISESPATLGWSQSAVKAIGGQVARILSALKSGISALSAKAISTVKFVNNVGDPGELAKTATTAKTGSRFAGWVSQKLANKLAETALWSVIGVLTKLLSDVVIKSFRTTKETLNSLAPAVGQPA